jgi:hypothetical protein
MATRRNTFFQDPNRNDVQMFENNAPDTSSLVDRVTALNEQWDNLGLDDTYGEITSIETNLDLPARVEKLEGMVRRHIEQGRVSPAKRVTERA